MTSMLVIHPRVSPATFFHTHYMRKWQKSQQAIAAIFALWANESRNVCIMLGIDVDEASSCAGCIRRRNELEDLRALRIIPKYYAKAPFMGEAAREPLPVVRIEHCVVHHGRMYLLRIGIPADSMVTHLTGRINTTGENCFSCKKNSFSGEEIFLPTRKKRPIGGFLKKNPGKPEKRKEENGK